MKIVFFESEKEEIDFFEKNLSEYETIFIDENLDEDIDFKKFKKILDADILSVFIYSNIDKKILDKFKNLKAIVTRSTGFDHIDIQECRKRKISVFNVPFYGTHTVAEHTLGLMLSLSRRIPESYLRTRKGNFSLEELSGFDLKGKCIGIVGMGNIGKNVAKLSKSFGMDILAYDSKKRKSSRILKIRGIKVKYVSLENLLANSDFVSIHLPYSKKTHHLINGKRIKLMKKGAFIINTSRGGIIDTGALVSALEKKHLGGAGLDVLEEENLIKEEAQLLSKNFPKEKLSNLLENHMLLRFDNVIITPHNAFNSKESIKKIRDSTLSNINCIINRKKCKNKIR